MLVYAEVTLRIMDGKIVSVNTLGYTSKKQVLEM
jgi:hypothetical protein